MHSIYRCVVVAIIAVVSWSLSAGWFGFATDDGSWYADSLAPVAGQPDGESTWQEHGVSYEHSDWEPGLRRFTVRKAGARALEIYAGSPEQMATFMRLHHCGVESGGDEAGAGRENPALVVAWEFRTEAREAVTSMRGSSAEFGCRVLVSFASSPVWTPHARDVEVEIPRGGIVPLVRTLLDRAQVADEPTVRDVVAETLAADIMEFLDYELLEQRLDTLSLAYGPIQFATLQMTLVAVMLIVASVREWWARDASELAMNLVPYIGFFGTLVGMGDALMVLGQVDLSDPVSKATNLGPIGSKLGLAIGTTQYALVCYGVATVFLLVRDSVFRQRDAVVGGQLPDKRVDLAQREGRRGPALEVASRELIGEGKETEVGGGGVGGRFDAGGTVFPGKSQDAEDAADADRAVVAVEGDPTVVETAARPAG